VDAALDRVLPSEEIVPVNLHRAMRYSVLAPGKRLATLSSPARGVGGAAETVLGHRVRARADPRVLVDPRRPAGHGRRRLPPRPLNNHKVFGEAMAILAATRC